MNVQIEARPVFPQGEELFLHLRELDLFVYRQTSLSIDKKYVALLSVISNLQSCKIAATQAGLDNPEGVLWTMHSFPLKHRILPTPQQCRAECLAHKTL